MFKFKIIKRDEWYIAGNPSDIVVGDIIMLEDGFYIVVKRVEKFEKEKDEFIYGNYMFDEHEIGSSMRQVPRGTRFKKLIARHQ